MEIVTYLSRMLVMSVRARGLFRISAIVSIGLQLMPSLFVAYTGVSSAETNPAPEIYRLKDGEDVWKVSGSLNMTPHELRKYNSDKTPQEFSNISSGDVIYLPGGSNRKVEKETIDKGEYTLASNLSQAANLSTAGSDAQKNMAIGLLSSTATNEVQGWLNQFGTTRIQMNLDKNLTLDGSS